MQPTVLSMWTHQKKDTVLSLYDIDRDCSTTNGELQKRRRTISVRITAMDKRYPELQTKRLHGSSPGHGRMVVRVPAFFDRHFTGSRQPMQLVAIVLILSCCWSPVLSEVITRDVCVIGGGSSGTYAALRLRDLGKTVVVVERNNRLGGHTHTYTDPATNAHIDYGVIVFHDLPIVKNYFARFDIPLTKLGVTGTVPGLSQRNVDFRTGLDVANYIPSDPTAALAAYTAQLTKYPYLEEGFDLEYPVPEDLLLPFSEFVTKYALEPAVQIIFQYGQGLGDLLRQPTIYVLKNFNLAVVRDIQTGFLTSAGAGNGELYDKALLSLGEDVLLRSRVVSTKRNAAPGYAEIKVATPSGLKTIRAKQIVLSIPPKLDNLRGFDLTANERSLFGQFRNAGYYAALLRNTGIPDNVQVNNVGADTAYNLPVLPGAYAFSTTIVPGLRDVKFGSPNTLSDSQVKADIIEELLRLRRAGLQTTIPEFVAYESHIPFELTVPTDAIRNGFYKKLTALQGSNRTWYTGAAFHTHDSTLIWIFTEALVGRIVLA